MQDASPATVPARADAAEDSVAPRVGIAGRGAWRSLFVAALVLSVVVLIVLVASYGLSNGANQFVALAWVAVPIGFALFLVFAGRVPRLLERVRHRQIFGQAFDWERFYRETERGLDRPSIAVFAVVCPILVFAGWYLTAEDGFLAVGTRPLPHPTAGWSVEEVLELTGAMFISAVAALGLARMAVLGSRVSSLGASPELHTQPDHPDGCGGLGPIGTLCLWNAIILAVPGSVLGLAILFYEGDNVAHVVFGVITLVVAAVAFMAPLYRFHLRMEIDAEALLADLERHSARMDELTRNLITRSPPLAPADYKSTSEELERERMMYVRLRHPPRWPINAGHLVRFLASQVIPVIGTGAAVLQLFI